MKRIRCFEEDEVQWQIIIILLNDMHSRRGDRRSWRLGFSSSVSVWFVFLSCDRGGKGIVRNRDNLIWAGYFALYQVFGLDMIEGHDVGDRKIRGHDMNTFDRAVDRKNK